VPLLSDPSLQVVVVDHEGVVWKVGRPVHPGASLSYSFFHSYNKSLVEEEFILAEKGIVPSRILYTSDSYDYRESTYESDVKINNGIIEVSIAPGYALDILPVRVAYYGRQQLVISSGTYQKKVELNQLFKAGEGVMIQIKKRSVWSRLLDQIAAVLEDWQYE